VWVVLGEGDLLDEETWRDLVSTTARDAELRRVLRQAQMSLQRPGSWVRFLEDGRR
jgi:hypothetical protein